MKKALALLLAGVMCVSMLASCGAKAPASTPKSTPESKPAQSEPAKKEEPKVDSKLVVSKAGTITPDKAVKEVLIEADGVVLENATLDKVTVSAKLAEGTATLNKVTAKTLDIQGGGKNSVNINASTIGTIISKRAEGIVHIVMDKASTADSLTVASNTILDVAGAVKQIVATDAAKGSVIDVQAGAKVDAVSIKAPVELALNASIASLALSGKAEGSKVVIAKTATVATLATEVKVDVKGEGKITQVVTDDKANVTSTIKPGKTVISDNPVDGDKPATGAPASSSKTPTKKKPAASSSSAPAAPAPEVPVTPPASSSSSSTPEAPSIPVVPVATVTDIIIDTDLANKVYNHGAKLDLTGLSVKLTMSDGTSQIVLLADFEKNGIAVSPANGTALTNDNTVVTVTHTASGAKASTDVTVYPINVRHIKTAAEFAAAMKEAIADTIILDAGADITLTTENMGNFAKAIKVSTGAICRDYWNVGNSKLIVNGGRLVYTDDKNVEHNFVNGANAYLTLAENSVLEISEKGKHYSLSGIATVRQQGGEPYLIDEDTTFEVVMGTLSVAAAANTSANPDEKKATLSIHAKGAKLIIRAGCTLALQPGALIIAGNGKASLQVAGKIDDKSGKYNAATTAGLVGIVDSKLIPLGTIDILAEIKTATITGKAMYNETLTATATYNIAEPSVKPTLAYEWSAYDKVIDGQTGATLLLDNKAYIGKTISVKITATGTAMGNASSLATSAVAKLAAPAAPKLVITSVPADAANEILLDGKTPGVITVTKGSAVTAKAYEYQLDGKAAWADLGTTITTTPGTHSVVIREKIVDAEIQELGKPSAPVSVTVLKTALTGTVTITGITNVGQKLTATVTAGSNTSGTKSYKWTRAGDVAVLSTTADYTTVLADAGKFITCEISDTDHSGTIKASTAAITKAALAGTLTLAPAAPVVGTAITATLAPADTNVTYAWYQGTTLIVGAAEASYTPVDTYFGKTIKCVVTATKDSIYTGAVTSAETSKVSAKPFAATDIRFGTAGFANKDIQGKDAADKINFAGDKAQHKFLNMINGCPKNVGNFAEDVTVKYVDGLITWGGSYLTSGKDADNLSTFFKMPKDATTAIFYGSDGTTILKEYTKELIADPLMGEWHINDGGFTWLRADLTLNDLYGSPRFVFKNADGKEVASQGFVISAKLPPVLVKTADFEFTDGDKVTKTYGDPAKYTNTIINGVGDGAITYASGTTTVATVDPASGAVTIVSAGETIITATKAANVDGKYVQKAKTYTLTVKPIALTLTGVKATDRAYDGTTDVVLAATLDGVLATDKAKVTLTAGLKGSIASANASDTALAVTLPTFTVTGAAAANYTVTAPTAAVTVKITKAPITITAGSIKATSRPYAVGKKDVVLTGGAFIGAVNNEAAAVIDVTFPTAGTITSDAVATAAAVTFTAPTLKGTGIGNYSLTPYTSPVTVAITAAPVTNTGKAKSEIYAGKTVDVATMFTLDAKAGVPTYTMAVGTGTGTFAGTMLTVTKAGTFTISVTTAANGNYAAGAKVDALLTVELGAAPAAPSATFTKTDATTNGGKDGKISGFGTASLYEYKLSADTTYTTSVADEVTGLAAGTYKIRLKATDLVNASAAKDVVIGEPAKVDPPSEFTLTVKAGSVEVGKTVQISPELIVGNGDGTFSYVSTDSATATVNATGLVTGVKVGTITITVTQASSKGFTASSKTFTVTVTAAP